MILLIVPASCFAGTIAPSFNMVSTLTFGMMGLMMAFSFYLVRENRKLKESEFRWRFAVEGSGEGIWDWNLQTNTYHCSKRWKEMFGYGDDETLPTHAEWLNLIHPNDRENAEKILQAYFDGSLDHYRVEYRLRKKDNSYQWILSRGIVASRNKDNSPLRMLGTHTDISKRKQSEEMLRKLFTAVEQSSTSVIITDIDAQVEYVNPRFSEITGYSADEIVRQNPRILQSGLMPQEIYSDMWKQLASGLTWKGELYNKRKNGEHYWEEAHIAPVKNEEGIATHYVAVKTDITKRKNMEDQVQHMAFFDCLTKLPNRRLLGDRLALSMASSKRTGCYSALMFLDLDNFKSLNDTYGHGIGDLLLIEVAERLKSCVREIDTVARFGGDEFIVILNDLNKDKMQSISQAKNIAEKIRSLLSKPYLLSIPKEGFADSTISYHCTASVGIVVWLGYEATRDDILKWADDTMYKAKENGRNQILFYT
ncbi:MAG: diguanylate cyclase [Campylobacteraceae bacterium]|nr:diguanylate cyclase [Campylobacteraceae bacterium]